MKKVVGLLASVGLLLLGSTHAADLSMCNGGIFDGGEVRYGYEYPISDTFHTANAAIFGAEQGTYLHAQNANVGAFSFTNNGNWGGPVQWVIPGSTVIATSQAIINQQSKDIVIEWHIANCAFNGSNGCVAGTENVHVECMKLQATWCGDGKKDAAYEQCDGSDGVGANQSCNSSCQIVNVPVDCQVSAWSDWGSCTNGQQTRNRTITVQPQNGGQACPALTETRGCSYCGDGQVNAGEQCDDGNTNNGDGCNNSCQNEPDMCPAVEGFQSTKPTGSCDDGNNTTKNDSYGDDCICRGVPKNYCGDGTKQTPNDYGQNEQCDGQSGVGVNQSCTNQCTLVNNPYCGDGIKNNGEQCDYSDASQSGWGRDGCNNSCQPINNPRYKCSNYACIQDDGNGTYTTSNCNNSCGTAPYCGDGVRNNGEVCDFNDGSRNNWGNSGCSNQCQQINNPVCQDPNAENQGQVGACIYKYACTNGYQCVQQKGGQYSSSNCDNVCVAPAQADVQITKSVDRPTFPNTVGERITWTLTYKNNGPAAAENVVVVDILPESLRKVVSMTMNAGKIEAGGKYTWYLGTLQPGQGGTITIVSEYEGGKADNTDLTNVVSIATSTNGDNPNNNNGSATTKPYSNPTLVDVQILKSVDRVTFPNKTGEVITWTLDYKNNGPATAENVVVVDIIPKELTYLLGSVDGSKYTFTAEPQVDGTTKVTWIFKNSLPVGATGSFTVKTQYRGGYPDNKDIINAVAITAKNDSNPNNNTDSKITKPISSPIPQADVQITKSVDRPTFPNKTGEIITWTLTYKNNGPATAENVVITDTLPVWMRYLSSSLQLPVSCVQMPVCNVPEGTVGIPDSCLPIVTCNPLRWDLGTLASGQTGSITITTKYLGGIINGSGIINNATISTTTTGDNPNNNTGSAVTTPYGSGTASLGNYVWIDKDKDGIQDADEVALSGVKVELYKITSCTADLGTPLMTTTTNGSGFYLFTGLEAGNYKVKFTLPNGYEFTMPNQGSDDAVDSDAGLNGVTSCVELKEGENNMTVDAGVVLNQPISCEGMVLSTTSMSVGGTVNYTCSHKNATSAIVTVTLSGSTTGVVNMTGFTGQFSISQAGIYNVQCTLDNGVTYKVVTYSATGGSISCAYKKNATTNDVCAVKSALDPFVSTSLNLSGLIYMPTPYPYCTAEQIANTSYQCVDAPAGSQIVTRQDGMCRAQLTVTAGGGGCTSNCGGGHYDFCGDGAVNNGEQCDDGNKINGDGCSNQCQREGTTPPTVPTTGRVFVPKSILCESIDPPSINSGEYLPFWWTMEENNDINVVSSTCAGAVEGETNIVRDPSGNNDNDPVCYFNMQNAAGESSTFSRYCFEKNNLTQYPLFQSFFSTRPVSNKGYLDAYSSSTWGGTSYFGPSNWSNGGFTKLGEYKLSLYKTTFKQCIPQYKTVNNVRTLDKFVMSSTRYESKNDDGFGRECSFNFTVTTPYFVQDGLSLSTTSIDANIIRSFEGFNLTQELVSNIKEQSAYTKSSNLTYLAKQFVEKYSVLATSDRASNGSQLPPGFKKVPGKEIYVYSNIEKPVIKSDTPIRGTLISMSSDIEIQGNVDGIAMIIAPNNTIDFVMLPQQYNTVQSIKGIYIAKKITSSSIVRNNKLSNEFWASKGGVRVKGIMISDNPVQDIRNLVNARRSHLEKWFTSDTLMGQNNKKDAILQGAALTIETDPSFWTSLPPGANELMSALETYK